MQGSSAWAGFNIIVDVEYERTSRLENLRQLFLTLAIVPEAGIAITFISASPADLTASISDDSLVQIFLEVEGLI